MTSSIQSVVKDERKGVFVLLDPDHYHDKETIAPLIKECDPDIVKMILIGGSLVFNCDFEGLVNEIKRHTSLPVVIFPGNNSHLCANADAVLFLSLISGRNPEFLIGQQVVAAPVIRQMGLPSISTGYMLIGEENQTTARYMSASNPIPKDKNQIASATALAGELIGMKTIYMDAGSGAPVPVPVSMIKEVKRVINIPLIIGGGINTPQKAKDALDAGADYLVIGNGLQSDKRAWLSKLSSLL